jgi:RNA recognition motif-containing protein
MLAEEATNPNQVQHESNGGSDKKTSPSNKDNNKANSIMSLKEQLIQNQKDRTLFCVNIDEKCTEEILYELFLQVKFISNTVVYTFLPKFRHNAKIKKY